MPGPEIVAAGPSDREVITALDRAVFDATGHPALGDAVWRDLDRPAPDSTGFVARSNGQPDAYLHVARSDTLSPSHWDLGLALRPHARDDALAGALLDALVGALLDAAASHTAAHGGGGAILWVFDPTPDDDARLASHGFRVQRDLYQMRVGLPIPAHATFPPDTTVRAFEPGHDEAAWLHVNNRAFAGHPEQGGWTEQTLARRMAEPWFDPELFLLALDGDGLAGFDWLKVHPATDTEPTVGEIFVIGVDPSRQGRGLGRALAVEGLQRLAARGITVGMLFVAAENTGALALYRDLGFVIHRVDRAYERRVGTAASDT